MELVYLFGILGIIGFVGAAYNIVTGNKERSEKTAPAV
jgi:hypothetical protein